MPLPYVQGKSLILSGDATHPRRAVPYIKGFVSDTDKLLKDFESHGSLTEDIVQCKQMHLEFLALLRYLFLHIGQEVNYLFMEFKSSLIFITLIINKHELQLHDIFINPKVWAEGLGKATMACLLEICSARGWTLAVEAAVDVTVYVTSKTFLAMAGNVSDRRLELKPNCLNSTDIKVHFGHAVLAPSAEDSLDGVLNSVVQQMSGIHGLNGTVQFQDENGQSFLYPKKRRTQGFFAFSSYELGHAVPM